MAVTTISVVSRFFVGNTNSDIFFHSQFNLILTEL